MSHGDRQTVMYGWARDRAGLLAAWIVGLAGAIGVILGIAGAIASNRDLSLNGWTIAVLAAVTGWVLRVGYRIGARARFDHLEEQLKQIQASIPNIDHLEEGLAKVQASIPNIDRLEEELGEVHASMHTVEDILTGGDQVVRPFRRRNSE